MEKMFQKKFEKSAVNDFVSPVSKFLKSEKV